MRTIDESIAVINGLGYLVQSISQSHFGGWDIAVNSPFEWYMHRHTGKTMAEACDKAATDLSSRGPALSNRQRAAAASGGKSRPGTKRVRLKAGRVRLDKEKVRPQKGRTRLLFDL